MHVGQKRHSCWSFAGPNHPQYHPLFTSTTARPGRPSQRTAQQHWLELGVDELANLLPVLLTRRVVHPEAWPFAVVGLGDVQTAAPSKKGVRSDVGRNPEAFT